MIRSYPTQDRLNRITEDCCKTCFVYPLLKKSHRPTSSGLQVHVHFLGHMTIISKFMPRCGSPKMIIFTRDEKVPGRIINQNDLRTYATLIMFFFRFTSQRLYYQLAKNAHKYLKTLEVTVIAQCRQECPLKSPGGGINN